MAALLVQMLWHRVAKLGLYLGTVSKKNTLYISTPVKAGLQKETRFFAVIVQI